jgi:hypothetical protein
MESIKRNHTEVRIRGVSKRLIEELNNIAENTGVPLSQILKQKLREIADSYPDKMKRSINS